MSTTASTIQAADPPPSQAESSPPPPTSPNPFKRRSRELDIDPPPAEAAASGRATRAELTAVRQDIQDVAVGTAVTARDMEYLRAEVKAIRDTQTEHSQKLDLILGVFEQIPGLKGLLNKPGMTGKQKAVVIGGLGGFLYLLLELVVKLWAGAGLMMLMVWVGGTLGGCASGPETAPFEFVEGGGSGYFKGRVYGMPLTVEVDAVALADGEDALFCPVVMIGLGGWVTTGTHEGAHPACKERFGVIRTPRFIPPRADPLAPSKPPTAPPDPPTTDTRE